jgi:hypothetical protein
MTKEKITPNTSVQDVLPALAGFLAHYDKEQITAAPVTVKQMFNDLMATPFGDNPGYREQCLMTLNVIADLGNAISPFPESVLHNFYQE